MPPVVLGLAAIGTAFFIPTFVAGALGASLALGLANLGVGLIVSGIAAELMPKPSLPAISRSRTVSIRQAVGPRETVYGDVRKGGTIIFMDQSSGSTYLHLVIVLAAHEVESIGAIYFNGVEAIDASGSAVDRYVGFAEVEKVLGAPGQTVFPGLAADLPEKWTDAHKLTGCAAIALKMKFDSDVYPNGLPAITADMLGKNDIYDPRTTLRGYTNNAALCVADLMSDSAQVLKAPIGGDGGINTASLIEAANVCDEDVNLAGGGTEKRYTINGVIPDNFSPEQVLPQMALAMAGAVIWRGNDFDIMAGAYRSPTLTFNDDDVVSGGLTLATRVTRAENFNGVRGQFVSPENNWQPDDFPAYQSSVYVAEDGGDEVWVDISLPFTTSASAAQRIAKILLEKNRRQQTVKLNGKLSTWRAVTGQTINLTYARWGYASKPFEVIGIELAADDGVLRPMLSLRETSPLVYDWESTEQQIYDAAPLTDLPSPFDIDEPGVPTLSEELYATRDGSSVRALIRASWGASVSPFVVEYQIQGRRTLDGDGLATGDDWITFGRTDQTVWEIRDIAPGRWEVQIAAISTLGVKSAYATASIEAFGLSSTPVTLTGLGIQTAGGLAILTWDTSPDLDVRIGGRIVVRHSNSSSPVWANSTSLDEVDGNNAIAVVPLKPGTYLLRPMDSSGIMGPVSTVVTKGAQALTFGNLSTLAAHPTWAGTKSNCEVVGTDLVLVLPEENLTPDPDDLTAVGYTLGRATISADVATPPGGSATADKLVDDLTAANTHFIYFTAAVTAGKTYRQSAVVKADGRNRFQLQFATAGFPTGAAGTFNLTAGTSTIGAGASGSGITDLGDGWFEVWAEAVSDVTFASNFMLFVMLDDTGSGTYDGDGVSGIIISDWRMIEKLSPPENAVNWWTLTRATVSANQATPPGYSTAVADKLVEDSSTGTHIAQFPTTTRLGYTYKWSIVAKAAGRNHLRLLLGATIFTNAQAVFDLSTGEAIVGGAAVLEDYSIVDLGDGWYRCSITAIADLGGSPTTNFFAYTMPDDTNVSYTGDGASGILLADSIVEIVGEIFGTYEFATTMDLTTVKLSRVRSDVKLSALNLAGTIDERTALIDTWADFDDTDGSSVDVLVEGRFTDDDPAGTPTWSDWKRVDSTEEEFRGAQFRATLITETSDFNLLVEELTITADEVV